MSSARLIVDYQQPNADGHVVLRVSGQLQQATTPLLDGVLLALREFDGSVTVDLAGVDHIDARGLELLLAADVEVIGVRESLQRPASDESAE